MSTKLCIADGCVNDATRTGRYCLACAKAASLAPWNGGVPTLPTPIPDSVREYRQPDAATPYLPIARRRRGAVR